MAVVSWSDSGSPSLPYEVVQACLGPELSAVDRTDLWRDYVARNRGRLEVRFDSPADFWAEVWTQRAVATRSNSTGCLEFVEFVSGAAVYERSDEIAESGGDDTAGLYITIEGRVTLHQDDHAVELGPGRMGVVRYDQGMGVSHGDGAHGYLVGIPSYVLPSVREPRGLLRINRQNAILKSIRLLAGTLAAERLQLTATEFATIGKALVDLVAGVLDQQRAPQLDTYARIAADARRRIELYSNDPRLTVQTLADSLGCSRRQLEIAMKTATGSTPGEQLRETRLQRAYERLTDPENREAIVDVATSTGYSSLSGFRASFAARFDVQPGELKLRSRSSDPSPSRPPYRN
ncbi:helix-turn-helix domain-containing protein [Nocardia brasiliensis]|uniref:Putative transcriptional regulator n=1 Tax=Nocardia brasiliensis (strain ATCC 700358 / HUJEG-1) TaxID=1133849 RepID=K0F509_NOCB7|nr:AraC family transcriptional regulator [Nocardia brasiliensis]AFU02626.1 putative transcriptional regulator [Nocardia brasiliensis ATCC 700358]